MSYLPVVCVPGGGANDETSADALVVGTGDLAAADTAGGESMSAGLVSGAGAGASVELEAASERVAIGGGAGNIVLEPPTSAELTLP
jgi:hypothetical protein